MSASPINSQIRSIATVTAENVRESLENALKTSQSVLDEANAINRLYASSTKMSEKAELLSRAHTCLERMQPLEQEINKLKEFFSGYLTYKNGQTNPYQTIDGNVVDPSQWEIHPLILFKTNDRTPFETKELPDLFKRFQSFGICHYKLMVDEDNRKGATLQATLSEIEQELSKSFSDEESVASASSSSSSAERSVSPFEGSVSSVSSDSSESISAERMVREAPVSIKDVRYITAWNDLEAILWAAEAGKSGKELQFHINAIHERIRRAVYKAVAKEHNEWDESKGAYFGKANWLKVEFRETLLRVIPMIQDQLEAGTIQLDSPDSLAFSSYAKYAQRPLPESIKDHRCIIAWHSLEVIAQNASEGKSGSDLQFPMNFVHERIRRAVYKAVAKEHNEWDESKGAYFGKANWLKEEFGETLLRVIPQVQDQLEAGTIQLD